MFPDNLFLRFNPLYVLDDLRSEPVSFRASRFEIRVNTFDARQRLDSQCLTCVHKKYLDYQKYLNIRKIFTQTHAGPVSHETLSAPEHILFEFSLLVIEKQNNYW